MAMQVKSADMFRKLYSEHIVLEKTKGGLGARFHSAVVQLLNENPTAQYAELAKLFIEELTAVENELTAELVEAFGEDATVKDNMPQWKQYKSDYKVLLTKADRRDIMKTANISQAKKLLGEIRKEEKERDEGTVSSDTNPEQTNAGASGGAPVNDKVDNSKLPNSVRDRLNNAIKALELMSADEAERIVSNFEGKAWSVVRNKAGTKKAKVAAATGSANKAAANA